MLEVGFTYNILKFRRHKALSGWDGIGFDIYQTASRDKKHEVGI